MALLREELLSARLRLQDAPHSLLAEVFLDATRLRHQLHQPFGLMGVQVIDHEHVSRFGVRRDRLFDVRDEVFLRARRPQRRADDLPGDHMEVADQRQRPVAFVLELPAFRPPRLHRQRWADPPQSLDAGHLVDADGVGVMVVVQLRSIEVAGADHLHLRLEHFGVFLLGVQPVTALMRLQLRLAQVATDLRRGDRGDDASEDGFVGEFGQGPVSNRSMVYALAISRRISCWRSLMTTLAADPAISRPPVLEPPTSHRMERVSNLTSPRKPNSATWY